MTSLATEESNVLQRASERVTDLEVGDEGHPVVHGHAADQEVVLDEACVVVGQVHHQVNVTVVDEASGKKND